MKFRHLMRTLHRIVLLAAFAALTPYPPIAGADPVQATVYKSAACGCCKGYIGYLEKHGFEINAIDTPNLPFIKQQHGIPEGLQSCHTMLVGGYVVEGHVPVSMVQRLLEERPKIKGIALPGMPQGSPGMSGKKIAPFVIYEIRSGWPRIYGKE